MVAGPCSKLLPATDCGSRGRSLSRSRRLRFFGLHRPNPLVQRHGVLSYSLSILAHAVRCKAPIFFIDSVAVRQGNESPPVRRLLRFSDESNTTGCHQLWGALVWLLRDSLVNVFECRLQWRREGTAWHNLVVRRNCVGQQLTPLAIRIDVPIIDHCPSEQSQIRSFPATDKGAPDIDTRRESLLPFRASQCRQTVPAVRQARRSTIG